VDKNCPNHANKRISLPEVKEQKLQNLLEKNTEGRKRKRGQM
jgi:hypothetical protein